MTKWLKQNLNIAVVFTLVSCIAMGIAYAAVLNADVQRLKEQTIGMPERLGRLEQKTDDIKESVHRIEGYFKYE